MTNWRAYFSKRNLFIAIFLLLAINIFFSAGLLYCFLTGATKESVLQDIPFSVRQKIKSQILWFADLPYAVYYLFPSRLPTYNLYIEPDKLAELNENLPKKGGLLDETHKDEKKAKFIYDGKKYNVEVRYRGSTEDNWLFEKKSWRVKFKSEDLFNGMKSINLIIPSDRNFVIPVINSYRAKKFGLKSPFFGSAVLKINGKNYGTYLVYEQWGDEFLERNSWSDSSNLYGEKQIDEDMFKLSSFWDKYNQDPINKINNFAEIEKLIELINYTSDQDFTKKIFNLVDEENFYSWQVHSVLMDSVHQDTTHNIRVVFNNVIGKFQFIPWDVNLDAPTDEMGALNAVGYNRLVERILKNLEFFEKRNSILWNHVSNNANLEDDLKQYDAYVKEIRIATYRDNVKNFSNSFFDAEIARLRNLLAENFKTVKKNFEKSEAFADIRINALENARAPVAIDVTTRNFSPLIFQKIEISLVEPAAKNNLMLYRDSNGSGKFDFGDKFLGNTNYDSASGKFTLANLDEFIEADFEIRKTDENRYLIKMDPIFTKHKFFITGAPSIENLSINLELKNYFSDAVLAISPTYIDKKTFAHFEEISESMAEFLRKNYIFRKISENKVYLSGTYVIARNIIIPKNLEVEIAPGTVLYFKKGISLVSYSPVKAIGTKNAPIKVLAANPAEPHGTFAIVDTQKKENEFKYAIFERGGQAYINGIFFSGTLALHRSDVKIENCEFKYATGDDGLNVKYASGLVKNSLFYKNNFDALDFDYVNGEISGNQFLDNGNDGPDISGSDVLIQNNIIKNSGDKGISVGERSTPKIYNNLIENCAIGIAVKDASQAEIYSNKLIKNKIGIAAYLKKSIYVTGGYAKITKTEMIENEKLTEIDAFSRIEFYE